MERKCFKDFCSKNIVFACNLENSSFLSCKKHIAELLITNKNYKIAPILKDLSIEEKSKTLLKIQEIFDFLKSLKSKSINFTYRLINNIINQSKSFETKISKSMKDIMKLNIRINNNKAVDSEFLSWVSDFNSDSQKKNY